MRFRLKALGLSVLAITAFAAYTVVNASATTTGHFESDVEHASVVGTESHHTSHFLRFQRTEPTGTFTGDPIVCTNANYSGTVIGKTQTVLEITPSYSTCSTTIENPEHDEVKVTMNGCKYTFFSNSNASTHNPTAHGTVAIDCEIGKAIEVHHPNCTMTVKAQTPSSNPVRLTGGVTYTTTLENNKHALTVNVTVGHIASEFHGGICIFLGTNKLFDMNGSVTVKGTNTAGDQVNITAT